MKKIAAGVIIVIGVVSCNNKSTETSHSAKQLLRDVDFVGSTACMECHKTEFSKWQGSHHDLAMQVADSTSVLADFHNTSFTYKKIRNSFFIEENQYFVKTRGPDGKYHVYKIEYTLGATPLQQYIIKFNNGKYQCLQVAWDTEKKKWFDLQPALDIKSNEWIHWSGGGMRWNTMCADCHSTNVHKNYDDNTNSYNTTYSEINAGCESCHGPSRLHVDYYKNGSRDGDPPRFHMDTSTVSTELVEKCARCHSRRKQITNSFDFKEKYLDHYTPSLIKAPNYELDGKIKGEVYVYGSFIQSKMYHNGVSCKDCHDIHSLQLKSSGNQLCLNCHALKYDSKDHHFHKGNSKGTQCINCHMVGKTYMGNDYRRDHSFRIPRPDQSVKFGTSNACTECHKGKSSKWASDNIVARYGKKRSDHFSDYLLSGYNGDNEALKKLMSGKKYPATARATALKYYASQKLKEDDMLELISFLKDESPLVRREAVIAFERHRFVKGKNHIEALLVDPLRSVRIAAAGFHNSMSLPIANNEAQIDYQKMLDVNADFAAGQLQIALQQQARGNINLSIEAYRKSIKIDNNYNQSRMNLALLYYQRGKIKKAEKLYLEVIEIEPEFSGAYYMLGLLYNEKGELKKAKEFLKKACETTAPNINALYNYSLVLQREGDAEESLRILEKALLISPQNEKFLHLKLSTLARQNQIDAAYKVCVKLLQIQPDNPEYLELQKRLMNSR